jgi:hypothetical protein
MDAMMRTIAEALREEGRMEGRREGELRTRRETLLRLLHLRFKKVPRAVERTVLTTDDLGLLDNWIDGTVTARSLDEIGIQDKV